MNNNEETLAHDDLREACGLFGCIASKEWQTNLTVAHIIHCGLEAVQHRGQEFAGIVTGFGDPAHCSRHIGTGLVSQAITKDDLAKLRGRLGIGQACYSTYGSKDISNAQPFLVHTEPGLVAVAHNGQLVNAATLRRKILGKGVGLTTNSDSELLTQILCEPPPEGEPNGPDFPARIKRFMDLVETAYSLLIMFGDKIYAVRDPYGNRPLCIGRLLSDEPTTDGDGTTAEQTDGYVVASESCAFFPVLAKFDREVKPGEIVEITKTGFRSIYLAKRRENRPPAFCLFEYIYFANASSCIEGQTIYSARYESGKQLAIEAPMDADIISGVPDSATPAAHGFADQSGIKYAEVFHVNRYVSRQFIQPSKRQRELSVRMKFGTLDENFKGKKIVLVDDSIVRGTTVGTIIKLLKDAGAAEVHLRIASPPVRHPCYMGINISSREELIANKSNSDKLAVEIGAASVVYLSTEGLIKAVKKNQHSENSTTAGHYCTACFTGNYPIKLEW